VRLTKYTHACVRLEHEGRVLVIDPGIWAEPEALDGVTDILVTHEHADHIDTERLKALTGVSIFTNLDLTAQLGMPNVQAVLPGDDFTAAGFSVRAVGGKHADIIDGLPGCANIGFIIDESIYHPGDSLFVPQERVDTLLVPASGPWLKFGEAIEFTRAIRPQRAIAIHDVMLSDKGIGNFSAWMEGKSGTEYKHLSPGTSQIL
jgi:L-ascorbate metabolism protein UlaG (beta-lactamase superfamily)